MKLTDGVTLILSTTLLTLRTVSASSEQQILQHASSPHDASDPISTLSEPKLGAVASESAICSKIGTSLLEAGGNAADAMVGTSLCVGMVGMYHSGIGGGGFMLVRDSNGRYEGIDFREKAPAAAYEHMYDGNDLGSIFGGLSAGVPGEIKGLEYLHKKYGKLPWRDVVQPAVKVGRDGFLVGKDLVRYMQVATRLIFKRNFLVEEPAWAEDFAPNGTLLVEGDTIYRRKYAATLEQIGEEGADIFYTGVMANATVSAIAASNGTLTMQDLADYEIISRPVLDIDYRDYKIFTVGSPAGGAVVLSTFKTIEGYEGMSDPSQLNISTHRLDEAIRFAYGERASLGDPDFVPGISSFESDMLSDKSAIIKRAKISDHHTLNVSDYNPDGFEMPDNHGTSQIVTADASGMAVTLTSTVNLIFGGGVIVPETGVIMNDEMNDFSIPGRNNGFGYPPSPSNYIRPGKRPMSSITPVIVEHKSNGTLFFVVGAAGGSRIITATMQNVWHALDHNMSAIEALYEPRFHDQLLPNRIQFEWGMKNGSNGTDKHPEPPKKPGHGEQDLAVDEVDASDASNEKAEAYDQVNGQAESGIGTGTVRGFDNSTVAFMAGRKHNVEWVQPGFSSAQAIKLCWNGTFEAASEPRQADSGGFAV